jgi:hypothetical protein
VKIKKPAWKQVASKTTCFHTGFLVGLFFDREDIDMLFRNVC